MAIVTKSKRTKTYLYYLAPIGGMTSHVILLHFFGPRVAVALAWVNSLAAVGSLCTMAVMYLPSDLRTSFLAKWGKFIPASILFGGLVAKELNGIMQYACITLTAAMLCRISFSAIESNNEQKTLLVGILSAILLPLSVVPSLIQERIVWAMALFILLVILTGVNYIFIRETPIYPNRATHTQSDLLIPVITALFAQLPLILFPIMEPRIMYLSDPNQVAKYLMTWKIVYGSIVLIYSKVQFRLAFYELSRKQIKLHHWLTVSLFAMVATLSIMNTNSWQIIKILLTAIFINEVALLVRNHLRISGGLLSSTITSILFLIITFVIYSDIIKSVASYLPGNILDYYPILICIATSTCLFSLLSSPTSD